MPHPISLYIHKDSGLQLLDRNTGNNKPDMMKSMTMVNDLYAGSKNSYTMKDPAGQFYLRDGIRNFDIFRSGPMSPTQDIDLNPESRGIGVPEEATKFAFAHPPPGFAEQIDWARYNQPQTNKPKEKFLDSPSMELTDDAESTSTLEDMCALAYFAILGGFIYFDDDMNVLSVNVVTLEETEFKFPLVGPFETRPLAIERVVEADRMVVMPFQLFHEASFVACAYIRPKETFGGQQAYDGSNKYGAFMMMRYDGVAYTFAVDVSQTMESSQSINVLSDIFKSASWNFDQFPYIMWENDFIHIHKVRKWKSHLKEACDRIDDPAPFDEDSDFLPPEMKEHLLFFSLAASLDVEYIRKLLDNPVGRRALNEKLDYGWNALHYACAFRPQDEELVELLIERNPGLTEEADDYGRYPLHIACDSKASNAVVKLLLQREGKHIVYKQTKRIKRSPLLIALSQGLSKETISDLINADEKGTTMQEDTELGCRPLHMAIGRKADFEIIQMLIEHEIKIRTDRKTLSIYSYYSGLLPLHLACLTNSSIEVVSLLMDRDVKGMSLEAGAFSILASDGTLKAWEEKTEMQSFKFGEERQKGEIVALQLAIHYGSEKVARAVMKKTDDNHDHLVNLIDNLGRNSLHLACIAGSSLEIVKSLLLSAAETSTGTAPLLLGRDRDDMRPIHYALMNERTSLDVIQFLMETEEHHFENSGESQASVLKDDTKSYLWHGCKAGSPESVIELVMAKNYWLLNGFEHGSDEEDLSKLVAESPTIQILVSDKLASRPYFCAMCLRMFVDVGALVLFSAATESVARGQKASVQVPLLIICSLFFALVEARQLTIQSMWSYFLEITNWYDIVNITSLSVSTAIINANGSSCIDGYPCELIRNGNPRLNKEILSLTAIVLVMNILIFLRTTFLPFAFFAQGLISIFFTLIPFFVVTGLILGGFAISYRTNASFDFWTEDLGAEQCSDSLVQCYLYMLHSLFGGDTQMKNFFDLAYGLFVVVILLNVVIAIISDAWEDSKPSAITMFWDSRMGFLKESGYFRNYHPHNPLFEWIDSFRLVPLAESVSWTKERPYTFVTRREEYENPFKYFDETTAQKIQDAQSLESTLNWIQRDYDSEGLSGQVEFTIATVMATTKWVLYFLGYVFWIAIGFATFGVLLPVEFRRKILSLGVSRE